MREIGGGVVFLRKIQRGGANRSFGIEVASLAGVPKDVTDRAKGILKVLEKNDVAKKSAISLSEIAAAETSDRKITAEEPIEERKLSEVEEILSETDVNTLSPMQALLLLSDLKEKLVK